ncbi:hypothetical protein EG240_02675 [Paenimyroides tangerinum]|uniref:Uncharacterized protein n=1 Tax=Paenimyroides tangerinum TaxID=2488728 RepID=A0A3P3WE77_9FLAO|nr:hypothetical protein [Paenimyroides tangerinum]RRJ92708.1 hypothetical protein EG240_02675 [Paenimyroides tangerinum]
MRNYFKSIIFIFLFSTMCNAQKNKIILIYSSITKELPVKIVLKENVTDTITSTIILQYDVNNLSRFVYIDTFIDEKVHLITNKRKHNYKLDKIKYLEFVDENNKKNIFTIIPQIIKKNIVEVKSQGKINYYISYSDKNIIAESHGYAYIEKDGKWTKHKKWINRSLFEKIQNLISDEPDLAAKLNQREIPQSEIFEILAEYNSRKL